MIYDDFPKINHDFSNFGGRLRSLKKHPPGLRAHFGDGGGHGSFGFASAESGDIQISPVNGWKTMGKP